LATLGIKNEELLQAIGAQAKLRIEEYGPQDIGNTA